MDNNWIVENLTNAFGGWNSKMTEMWSLLTESPQTFKGGTIWQTIVTINGGMQAIGYGLLVLFFAGWQIASTAGWLNAAIIPPLDKIFVALWNGITQGALLGDITISLQRAGLAFFGFIHGPAIGCVVDGCPPGGLPYQVSTKRPLRSSRLAKATECTKMSRSPHFSFTMAAASSICASSMPK